MGLLYLAGRSVLRPVLCSVLDVFRRRYLGSISKLKTKKYLSKPNVDYPRFDHRTWHCSKFRTVVGSSHHRQACPVDRIPRRLQYSLSVSAHGDTETRQAQRLSEPNGVRVGKIVPPDISSEQSSLTIGAHRWRFTQIPKTREIIESLVFASELSLRRL